MPSSAMRSPAKLAPPSRERATASAAPGRGVPPWRAAATVRLSSQAATSSPCGSSASAGRRRLAGGGQGQAQAAEEGGAVVVGDADQHLRVPGLVLEHAPGDDDAAARVDHDLQRASAPPSSSAP
ncbi:MAG: hypothetical protein U1F50_18510 [Rubrivivax sp.]